MFEVFLATMAMAVASFTLLLVAFQMPSPSKKPLILVLLCLALLSTGPIVFTFLPGFIQLYISGLPLLLFLLLPGLWFYHEALIAERQWQWKSVMWKHFSSLPFTVVLGAAIFHMPESSFNAMFISEQSIDEPYNDLLSAAFFAGVILWCVMSCSYVVLLLRRTLKYRQQLKNVFSNEQGKRLSWLIGVSLLISFSWVYALIVFALEDTLQFIGVSENGVLVLLVTIVWVICANGLRQRPGFEGNPPPTLVPPIKGAPHKQPTKMYERSALNSHDLAAIAERLHRAINDDKAHLDPDLTLAKLSSIARQPSQYITQTLSQHLRTTFFDFINNARINSAKHLLVETNRSVLDVALATGFNSRSSFYNAFKKFTDQTPSQYRLSKSASATE